MSYRIRKAEKTDLSFLWEMLRQAALWSGCEGMNVDEVMSRPEISVILSHWGASGDTAFLAESEADGRPVGAAWYRFYTEKNHSYGFVDPETPELAIAVEPAHRGRGVGTSLLKCLIAEAARQGVGKLCLSVAKANYAVQMYQRAGFENVDDESDDHWTMVLRLT